MFLYYVWKLLLFFEPNLVTISASTMHLHAVVMTSSLRPPTTEHVVGKQADIKRDLESVHDICVVVLIV